MNSLGQPIPFDPSYFTIKMVELEFYSNGSYRFGSITDLGTQDCTSTFPILADYFQSLNSSNIIICPQSDKYKVSGNYLSNKQSIFSIRLYKWVGSSNWKSESEINSMMNNVYFNIAIKNWYVNFDDYVNPIRSYSDDMYSYQLAPGFNKKLKLYVKQNQVELNDNFVQISNTQDLEFLNVEKSILDIVLEQSDGQIFDVSIRLDENRDSYKRVAYSFLDILGALGGVYQAVWTVLGLFINLISTEVLFSSVFKRLYFTNKIDPSEELMQINDKTSEFSKHNKVEEFKIENKKSRKFANMRIDESRSPSDINLSVVSNQNRMLASEEQNHSILSKLKSILINKRKYKASSCHKLYTLTPKWLCKNKDIQRK